MRWVIFISISMIAGEMVGRGAMKRYVIGALCGGVITITSVDAARAEAQLTSNISSKRLGTLCASSEVKDQSMCVGYVMGAMDTANAVSVVIKAHPENAKNFSLCPPDGDTNEKGFQAVLRSIQEIPELTSSPRPASYPIMSTLALRWPCQSR
jgi:hypothetical protein